MRSVTSPLKEAVGIACPTTVLCQCKLGTCYEQSD